jgi:hypothetical protein
MHLTSIKLQVVAKSFKFQTKKLKIHFKWNDFNRKQYLMFCKKCNVHGQLIYGQNSSLI